MSKILVTGGAGFIGSHTVVRLLERGFEPVIIDNFDNSCSLVVDRIEQITGIRPLIVEGDIRDGHVLDSLFEEHCFDSVIHFAGLKAVGESVEKPLRYYSNNVEGTVELLKSMAKHSCKKLVFSSSCTVYGDPETVPITEGSKLQVTNPYGRSKLMIENILRDVVASDPDWKITLLRYFNPVGAHPSGLIGEDPNGIPNNLMPFIAQVAVGRLPKLSVFGDDYPTHDGTGVRDYIHVVDLAEAHINAVDNFKESQGCRALNIGTGEGYSVLDMVKAFENSSGVKIPYAIEPRRSGDVAITYADPTLSEREIGWSAKLGLKEIMRDQWNWQKNNPNGYR